MGALLARPENACAAALVVATVGVARFMNDVIPVIFLVQIAIPLLSLVAARAGHLQDAEGADIFRIAPSIAWFLIVMSFGISMGITIIVCLSKSISETDLPSIVLGDMMFFFFGMYGIYCLTMRIRVNDQSICVKNLFRTRTVLFRDLRSADEKDNGRWRTLDVIDVKGRRILYVTNSFLPDYDNLVDLVQSGIDNRSKDNR